MNLNLQNSSVSICKGDFCVKAEGNSTLWLLLGLFVLLLIVIIFSV